MVVTAGIVSVFFVFFAIYNCLKKENISIIVISLAIATSFMTFMMLAAESHSSKEEAKEETIHNREMETFCVEGRLYFKKENGGLAPLINNGKFAKCPQKTFKEDK